MGASVIPWASQGWRREGDRIRSGGG